MLCKTVRKLQQLQCLVALSYHPIILWKDFTNGHFRECLLSTCVCKCLRCSSVSTGPSWVAPCQVDGHQGSSPEGLVLLTPRCSVPALAARQRDSSGLEVSVIANQSKEIATHLCTSSKATKKTERWSLWLPHSVPCCAKTIIPTATSLQHCAWAGNLSVVTQGHLQPHGPGLASGGEMLSAGIRLPVSASNMEDGMESGVSLLITPLQPFFSHIPDMGVVPDTRVWPLRTLWPSEGIQPAAA